MNRLNVAAIIAVRMSSQRLPSKPLVSYSPDGKPNLACIIDRVLSSRHNVCVTVATSSDKSDDAIAEWVSSNNRNGNSNTGERRSLVSLYRGSLDNVVERFDKALTTHANNADYVWRVMGDCPLVDIGLLDWRIDVLKRNKADVVTILQPEPTYAAQASVWSRAAWDHCVKISSGSLLQHPGEAIYESYGQFRTLHEIGPESVYYQNIRTELDTPQDLEFFRRVWKEYPPAQPWESVDIEARSTMYSEGDKSYDTKGVLTWLSSRPDIVKINHEVKERTKSTHLHGHSHARRFRCEECGTTLGNKYNDALDLQCPSCGTSRKFYL